MNGRILHPNLSDIVIAKKGLYTRVANGRKIYTQYHISMRKALERVISYKYDMIKRRGKHIKNNVKYLRARLEDYLEIRDEVFALA